MLVHIDAIQAQLKGQGHISISWSQEGNVRFSTLNAVSWLKNETGVGKTSYDTVQEIKAVGNDTVPFSPWSDEGTRSTECVALVVCLSNSFS